MSNFDIGEIEWVLINLIYVQIKMQKWYTNIALIDQLNNSDELTCLNNQQNDILINMLGFWDAWCRTRQMLKQMRVHDAAE